MADSTPNGTASEPASSQQVIFSATYKSLNNAPFTHGVKIPTSSIDKSTHLSALRKANTELQAQINASLTSRMEEDKAREAKEGGSTTNDKKAIVDEAKEMDNYGEEVPEEEE